VWLPDGDDMPERRVADAAKHRLSSDASIREGRSPGAQLQSHFPCDVIHRCRSVGRGGEDDLSSAHAHTYTFQTHAASIHKHKRPPEALLRTAVETHEVWTVVLLTIKDQNQPNSVRVT